MLAIGGWRGPPIFDQQVEGSKNAFDLPGRFALWRGALEALKYCRGCQMCIADGGMTQGVGEAVGARLQKQSV